MFDTSNGSSGDEYVDDEDHDSEDFIAGDQDNLTGVIGKLNEKDSFHESEDEESEVMDTVGDMKKIKKGKEKRGRDRAGSISREMNEDST